MGRVRLIKILTSKKKGVFGMYKFAYVHDSNYFLSKYFIYRNISGLGKLRTNVTLPTLGCICSVQDICNFSKIIVKSPYKLIY